VLEKEAEIKELRSAVLEGEGALREEEVPEDSVLLRYLFSAPTGTPIPDAAVSVQRAKVLRQEWASVLDKAARGEALPQEQRIRQHLCMGTWEKDDDESPLFTVVRAGHSQVAALMDNASHDEVIEFVLWYRASLWKRLNQKQERTGKFLLLHFVNDLQDIALLETREPRFFKALGVVADIVHDLFPCMSVKNSMVNVGWLWRALWGFAGLFLPGRVLNKVGICGASDTREQDMSECPYLRQLGIKKDELPDFLGGGVKVPHGSLLHVAEADDDVLEIAGSTM